MAHHSVETHRLAATAAMRWITVRRLFALVTFLVFGLTMLVARTAYKKKAYVCGVCSLSSVCIYVCASFFPTRVRGDRKAAAPLLYAITTLHVSRVVGNYVHMFHFD